MYGWRATGGWGRAVLLAALLAWLAGGDPARAGTITFDPTGTGSIGSSFQFDTFDWNAGNTLFDGIFPIPALSFSSFDVRSQAQLSGFNLAGVQVATAPAGQELTFQLVAPSTATTFANVEGFLEVDLHSSSGDGTFDIWIGAVDSNSVTGAGYDNGTLILSGTVLAEGGPFSGSLTIDDDGVVQRLDQGPNGVDNQLPIKTEQVSGQFTYRIEITFADSDYFLNDLVGGVLRFTTETSAPFFTQEPSDLVVGAAPVYGSDSINNDSCGTLSACDLHVLSDATSVLEMPEPGSALLLAPAALACLLRRRRLHRD